MWDQVIQRLQDQGNSCGETAGSRLVKRSERDCAMLDEADHVDWTGGGHSCSRDVGQMAWQQEGYGPTGVVS